MSTTFPAPVVVAVADEHDAAHRYAAEAVPEDWPSLPPRRS
jgi:hypothetical protein